MKTLRSYLPILALCLFAAVPLAHAVPTPPALQVLQTYLKPGAVGSTQDFEQFGYSVAISGDTAVVGARNEASGTTGVNSTPDELADQSGAVYVFTRSGTNWTQQAYLKASNPAATRGVSSSAGRWPSRATR